jgi:Uma2 family endonuclease
MESFLDPLVRSVNFPRYVDQLNELRRREELRRLQFRQTHGDTIRGEFINGEVIEHMTSRDAHTTTVAHIARLLSLHAQIHRLGAVRQEMALTAFTRNDYAPDICFFGAAKAAALTAGTTIYPVPDLICEVISDSTERRDRGVKREDYACHGVDEYWIVDPEGRAIDQLLLRPDGAYADLASPRDGVIRSRALMGFTMPLAAAFDADANLTALREMVLR